MVTFFCAQGSLMTWRRLCFTSDDNPTRVACKWEIQFGTPHIPANGRVNEEREFSLVNVMSCLLLCGKLVPVRRDYLS